MSAESGLKTFRDADGLWEGYKVEEVATPEAWRRNRELVQRFYNERRRSVMEAKPNNGHIELAKLEEFFNVIIITQNVDDLHERAGSTNVLHLHGEIMKACSETNHEEVYSLSKSDLTDDDRDINGRVLRPFIVWFGESVPKFPEAVEIVQESDVFVVIGTSLLVYPAASLVHYVKPTTEVYIIDPKQPEIHLPHFNFIQERVSSGIIKLVSLLQIN